MEPSSILILFTIIFLGVIVMGGGTMAFCCHGWERGLPFLSFRELFEELEAFDQRTVRRYKDFVGLVNEVTVELHQEAAKIPNKILLKEVSIVTEPEKRVTSLGCQTQSPRNSSSVEVVIDIPEE
jgi:hypothetical protein